MQALCDILLKKRKEERVQDAARQKKLAEASRVEQQYRALGEKIDQQSQLIRDGNDQLGSKIDQKHHELLDSFDKQSRLIVKAVSEKAPRYMVLLPLLQEEPSDDGVLSRLASFGKWAQVTATGVVKQSVELHLLCEGRLAGIQGSQADLSPHYLLAPF